MRVTNSMMVNNTINNIYANKQLMDKLNTQLSTKKKITRPSEDPVVAIRSLKLRSSLNELNQYYEKNIPDAISWLEVTESALEKSKDILDDFYEKCVYGTSGQLKTADRETLLQDLIALRDQIYAQGNADYAGRYVFTGYKTNEPLTFLSSAPTTSYQITEKFTGEALDFRTVTSNEIEVGTSLPSSVSDVTYPQSETVYRIRLSYDNIEPDSMTITTNPAIASAVYTTYENGTVSDGITTITQGMYENLGEDEIRYIPETGEVLFGANIYTQIQTMKDTGSGMPIQISYTKTGFEKGDLKPEHYFDCVKNPGTSEEITYSKKDQNIQYDISFNQSLNINIEAQSVFSPAIYRDVEELIDLVKATIDAENKVSKIENMKNDSQYSNQLDILDAMLDAANKEKELATNNMSSAFSKGVSKTQGYLDKVNVAITECGGRTSRLELTKSRLKEQQTNFTTLLSSNEDIDYEAVAIQYNTASTGYKASLMAAETINSISLLDYLR